MNRHAMLLVMLRRGLASLLVFSLATWAATPAFARVTCRPGFTHCAHCPQPKLDPAHSNLKADCCIVHPGIERAQVLPSAPHPDLAADLPAALDQTLLADLSSRLATVLAESELSPPPLQRKHPLLR